MHCFMTPAAFDNECGNIAKRYLKIPEIYGKYIYIFVKNARIHPG